MRRGGTVTNRSLQRSRLVKASDPARLAQAGEQWTSASSSLKKSQKEHIVTESGLPGGNMPLSCWASGLRFPFLSKWNVLVWDTRATSLTKAQVRQIHNSVHLTSGVRIPPISQYDFRMQHGIHSVSTELGRIRVLQKAFVTEDSSRLWICGSGRTSGTGSESLSDFSSTAATGKNTKITAVVPNICQNCTGNKAFVRQETVASGTFQTVHKAQHADSILSKLALLL